MAFSGFWNGLFSRESVRQGASASPGMYCELSIVLKLERFLFPDATASKSLQLLPIFEYDSLLQ